MISAGRRTFLKAGAAGLLLPTYLASQALAGPRLGANPFQLGIASGEPTSSGVVIWTRLAPQPLAADDPFAGMPADAIEVEWFVSEDSQLRQIVQQGKTLAEPRWAHSVHVEISGLRADRPYWYGFRTREWQSPIGRARTTAAVESAVKRLRFAFASCQNFEHGYYAAWRHLADQAPDLIIHLGDYIYEGSGSQAVRRHATREARNLTGYRARYAQYKSDPDLQAAHAATSWLLTWDDHEVDNDYAGRLSSEKNATARRFRERRAAAYQAWWEHMPARNAMRPKADSLPLHRKVSYGNLACFHLLDNRQYRSDQPCGTSKKRGGRVSGDCAERHDPSRSLLGKPQEQWLMSGLKSSHTKWNVLAQSLMMATLDQKPGTEQAWWTDGWDGYPISRDRLLDFIDQHRVSNPLVISGDIHSFWASELHSPQQAGRVVASEFVGSSISSRSISHQKFSRMLPDNPHVQFFDSRRRGFVMCELTQTQCRATFYAVRDATLRDSDAFKLASFVVKNGQPQIQAD